MCGEQANGNISGDFEVGSPPRVRGTVCRIGFHIYRYRITPACAGNRALRLVAPGPLADHPRVCGEQVPWASGKYGPKGSPPRVRGTVRPMQCMRTGKGITPACAGNRGNWHMANPSL